MPEKAVFFDVNDDPTITENRTVSSIHVADVSQSFSGPNISLNNAGQLVFRLVFTDGTEGIFIANSQFELGDVNGDGAVDLLDIARFVDLIATGNYCASADTSQDGVVDLLDVDSFVALLGG